MKFEWDEAKNHINLINHKINFETAVHVFTDPFRIEKYDLEHSIFEDRYITIGEIEAIPVVVFVVYTERSEYIRIISARKDNKKERNQYYVYKKRNRPQ